MKGKPGSLPLNHVAWINGFKSNMPDWPTARKCAVVDELLVLAIQCRSLLFLLQTSVVFTDPEIDAKMSSILKDLQESIYLAEFGPPAKVQFDGQVTYIDKQQAGDASAKILTAALKPFPKPPGVT